MGKVRFGKQQLYPNAPVLLHEHTFPSMLEVDVISIEVPIARDCHYLRHRPEDPVNIGFGVEQMKQTYPLMPTMHRVLLVPPCILRQHDS